LKSFQSESSGHNDILLSERKHCVVVIALLKNKFIYVMKKLIGFTVMMTLVTVGIVLGKYVFLERMPESFVINVDSSLLSSGIITGALWLLILLMTAPEKEKK
jgi:hypothetical protein